MIISQSKNFFKGSVARKTPTPVPFSSPSNFKPSIFRLDNIPVQRSRDSYRVLALNEEKKIIKCLASQVNINPQIDWPGGKVPESEKGEFSEPEFLAEYQKNKPLPLGFEERKTLYRLYNYLYRKTAHRELTPGKYENILTMMKKLASKYS